jgi:hypothetical protein
MPSRRDVLASCPPILTATYAGCTETTDTPMTPTRITFSNVRLEMNALNDFSTTIKPYTLFNSGEDAFEEIEDVVLQIYDPLNHLIATEDLGRVTPETTLSQFTMQTTSPPVLLTYSVEEGVCGTRGTWIGKYVWYGYNEGEYDHIYSAGRRSCYDWTPAFEISRTSDSPHRFYLIKNTDNMVTVEMELLRYDDGAEKHTQHSWTIDPSFYDDVKMVSTKSVYQVGFSIEGYDHVYQLFSYPIRDFVTTTSLYVEDDELNIKTTSVP